MSEETFEFTDRYKALGIPYPDPKTCCKGHCEGTGMFPMASPFGVGHLKYEVVADREYAHLWIKEHKKCRWWMRIIRFWRFDLAQRYGWKTHFDVIFRPCDGWHFVKCPDCQGTGKQP